MTANHVESWTLRISLKAKHRQIRSLKSVHEQSKHYAPFIGKANIAEVQIEPEGYIILWEAPHVNQHMVKEYTLKWYEDYEDNLVGTYVTKDTSYTIPYAYLHEGRTYYFQVRENLIVQKFKNSNRFERKSLIGETTYTHILLSMHNAYKSK